MSFDGAKLLGFFGETDQRSFNGKILVTVSPEHVKFYNKEKLH